MIKVHILYINERGILKPFSMVVIAILIEIKLSLMHGEYFKDSIL